MDSPNISIRIRRHESLPSLSMRSSAQASNEIRRNRTTASVLIGRRLGATKNNPYVGHFRHAPPTSFRSMAASSLPSLSSRREFANAAYSSLLLSPSFAIAENSPYVGWFRHAPPVFSSYRYVSVPASSTKSTNHDTTGRKRAGTTKPPRKPPIVQHKVNPDSLLALDRWHHQLTSLLLGVGNEDTEKAPPLILRQIINGRLLGGSGKDRTHFTRKSSNSNSENIIQRCNRMYQPHASRMPNLSSLVNASETIHPPGYKHSVLSRLTSWLLFPLLYADDECYDDYGCLNGDYGSSKNTTGGLKFLLSTPKDDRSIEIDSDDDDDDDYSSTGSVDYDPGRERSVPEGVTPELEREFSEGANLSVSEIADAYYAHQLIDERRRYRSNSDATATSQQSGLSPAALHHATDYTNGDEGIEQRLDYEITQMDIARMARNASRHLDVDSILNLPTIVYHKHSLSPTNVRTKQNNSHCEQSYNICTAIHEDHSESSIHGSSIVGANGTGNDETIHSEDGWSFMMVSDMKSSTVDNSVENSTCNSCSLHNVEDGGETSPAPTSSSGSSTDDMCVICLEPFREGDRLRVLPCNHSFHVGCIDRWLSGSHSHNECFTAGCPTCKKRPTLQSSSSSIQMPMLDASTEGNEDNLSGSLPSWAFANLGSAMAMSESN